ncbi:hypothetical protein [Asticcacaulis endophyticus]|uniref:hypothetical protein n=1 Tax=Asticcacaulis endophyticus TaxID=1395890 RepID=UPI001677F167|nr:hypothetical protein [Asticcacaulis endophyticus]
MHLRCQRSPGAAAAVETPVMLLDIFCVVAACSSTAPTMAVVRFDNSSIARVMVFMAKTELLPV